MLISEAMGGAVATSEADATVGRRVANGKTVEDNWVAVTSHGRLIGVIEREILRSVSLGNSPQRDERHDLMTPDPDFLEPAIRATPGIGARHR